MTTESLTAAQAYKWFPSLSDLMLDIQPDSIISRTLLKNDQVKVVLFGFDAGQSLSEHSAGQNAILQVIRGEAALTLGDDRFEARAGAWAFMPAGLKHAIEATTPLVLLLILLREPAS